MVLGKTGCVDQVFTLEVTWKKHNRVDWETLWSIQAIYGVGGQLLEEVNACASVDGELSDSFDIGVGLRQDCVMSPRPFNIFMDDCMRESQSGKNKRNTEA